MRHPFTYSNSKAKKTKEINISAWITEYWEEHGFNPESTQSILDHIQEVLLDQAIKVEIEVIADDNFYEENQNKDESTGQIETKYPPLPIDRGPWI